MEISLQHLHTQTVKAKELKFGEKIHLPPHVMCHISSITCHDSHVTCRVSHVMDYNIFSIFFLAKAVKLVDSGSVINGATPSSLCFILIFQKSYCFKWLGQSNIFKNINYLFFSSSFEGTL